MDQTIEYPTDCRPESTMRSHTDPDADDTNGRRDEIPWKLIGVLIAIGGLVTSIIGGWIGAWRGGASSAVKDAEWRGEMRASMAAITVQVTAIAKSAAQSETMIQNHEGRLTKIELQGSPRVERLEEHMANLEKLLQEHILTTKAAFQKKDGTP